MKRSLCFALIMLIIGCGSGVPSGSPDKSGDEALIESAFEYEIELVQKFFIPRIEEGIVKYLDYLNRTELVYGGLEKVGISEQIEQIEKIQLALPEFAKRWQEAESEIIERAEASENKVKGYIENKIREVYGIERRAIADEFDKIEDLKKKKAKDVDKKEKALVDKFAGIIVPKMNEILKKIGFKEDIYKKDGFKATQNAPGLPAMNKLPYEVVSNFRNIKTHIKYPVLKLRNDEYITELIPKSIETLVHKVDKDWYICSYSYENIKSRYFRGNIPGTNKNVFDISMNFIEQDFDVDISTSDDASKVAGRLYFLDKINKGNFNSELIEKYEDYLDVQNTLGAWVFEYNQSTSEMDEELIEFSKDNESKLDESEIEILFTELKKISADLDISITYMDIVKNDIDAAKADAKGEKKDKKAIVSKEGKFKLEEKITYLKVFLNLIGDEWRIIRAVKIDKPRKEGENKD